MRTILIVCALLAGCATEPVPTSEAKPAQRLFDRTLMTPATGSATLIVKRDRGMTGTSCNHRIALDGKDVAELMQGESVTLYPPPGEHVVSLRLTQFVCNGSDELLVRLEPGQQRVLRTAVDATGNLAKIMATAY